MNNGDCKANKVERRTIDVVHQGLAKRYRAERRFRLYGLAAIVMSLLCLAILFISIVGNGYKAFLQTYVNLEVFLDPALLAQENLSTADYSGLVKSTLRTMFPEVKGRSDKRELYKLISPGAAFQLREMVLKDPEIIGKSISLWVPADDDVDMLMKGHSKSDVGESSRRLSDQQLAWIGQLQEQGKIREKFNQSPMWPKT